jgi:hypothetical protein
VKPASDLKTNKPRGAHSLIQDGVDNDSGFIILERSKIGLPKF